MNVKKKDCFRSAEQSISLGVVIPLFGHSRLVGEAIESVLRQDFEGKIHVVVVIDGDRNLQTLDTARSFLSYDKISINVVYVKNGRLPYARNIGIKFLLSAVPDIFAIYFLDSDNRLSPQSLRLFAKELISDENAAWAYPDITFFGLTFSRMGHDIRETSIEFSKARLAIGNICEAGSMVRASVLKEGYLFDETFNTGFEDWEYWLSLVGGGFYGVRAPDPGFKYRRRADSMLADANRGRDEIMTRIGAKHHDLVSRENQLTALWEEASPIIVVEKSQECHKLLPNRVEPLSIEQLLNIISGLIQKKNWLNSGLLVLQSNSTDVSAHDVAFDVNTIADLLKKLDVAKRLSINCDGTLAQDNNGQFDVETLSHFLSRDFEQNETLGKLASSHYGNVFSSNKLNHLGKAYAGPAGRRFNEIALGHQHVSIEPDSFYKNIGARSNNQLLLHDTDDASAKAFLRQMHANHPFLPIDPSNWSHKSLSQRDHFYYNGVKVMNRRRDEAYRQVESLASIMPRVFVLNDMSYLFFIGNLKSLNCECNFVALDSLSIDQCIAMQAVEHSLNAIFVDGSNRQRLMDHGIPAHKMKPLADFIAMSNSSGLRNFVFMKFLGKLKRSNKVKKIFSRIGQR
jgi:hypothetical protein